MAELSHIKAQTLAPDTTARRVFILYLERFLGLVDNALELADRDDLTSSIILIRGALECYVDLFCLSRDGEDYLMVLRASLLENRSAIFHFRTKDLYDQFVQDIGEENTAKMGKEIGNRFREELKRASDRYPILRYQARGLSVLNRFRIAGMEDRYHTAYAWLSLQAHNALEPVLIGDTMRGFGGAMDAGQDGVEQAAVIHFAAEMLVDTLKCMEGMFGKDDAYTRKFLSLLEDASVEDK